MIHRLIAAAAVAVVMAGCGVFGGGTIAPNPWDLAAISPDETQLLVGTSYGADTSCSRFEGWEVTETDERVEILAMLWSKEGPGECNASGTGSRVAVQLDEPIGQRPLIGCGADECLLAEGLAGGFRGPPVVAANDGHAAVGDDAGLRLFDPEGTLLSTNAAVSPQRLQPVGDVFVSIDSGSIVAYDHVHGETRWTVPGEMKASDDEYLYVCTVLEGRRAVSQIQSDTGEAQWSVKAPCDFVVPLHDSIIMLGTVPTAEGELVVADRTTGAEITRRPFDDGTDNRINGARGATRVGDHAVVFGWQSDTIVLDGTGAEVTRRPRPPWRIGRSNRQHPDHGARATTARHRSTNRRGDVVTRPTTRWRTKPHVHRHR